MSSSPPPTLQFLFPMGGLGTRFAQIGIPTPKPLIHVDGHPMIHKALSSFEELMTLSTASTRSSALNIRVVFVVRDEHEKQFQLRTLLQASFADKYKCTEFYCVNKSGTDPKAVEPLELAASPSTLPSSSPSPASSSMSVYFVMMHADTQGAAETCLLAEPALILTAPVVILDCDLYVYSSRLNKVLLSMAGAAPSSSSSLSSAAGGGGDVPASILSTLRGALVFFNSKAPRYSYAVVEPIEGLDLSDPKGVLTSGGKVTRTAEKIPISNCSLIGAYTFAAAGWFVAAAKRLVAQPINPDTGLKEYYISLLYNFLLEPSFKPEGFEVPSSTLDAVLVLGVPKEGYASFGTPDELKNYAEGRESYVLE